jgi:peroxiredoxin
MFRVLAVVLAIFAFGLAGGDVRANPDFDLGPPVNARAPDIGTPADQSGKPRGLRSLMGEKGLVLFFFRSADWCPYCKAQLIDLNSGVSAIEAKGYKLAGISYDSPKILQSFTEQRGIRYTLLSDPKSEVIDRYKLRDPQYPPGNLAYGVPRPIIFILDKDGVIKSKLYEETYTKRPPVSLVIATIDQLAKK